MHQPVLWREVVDRLAPKPGGRYLDATLGGGGHAEAILDAAGSGSRLLGLDADPEAIARCRERLGRFGDRVVCVQSRFSDLSRWVETFGFRPLDGVVMDLGVSSYQLDDPARGFSFRADGPLDMRMDPAAHPSAADLVNRLPETELAEVFWKYGDEHRSRRVARAICERRVRAPFTTTADLAETVSRALGGRRGRIHPATRVFQALRIAVNRETEELDAGLAAAWSELGAGGRVAVITFHSLEDRAVKHFLADRAREGAGRPIERKPLRPSEEEISANPRARSAGLRVMEKV